MKTGFTTRKTDLGSTVLTLALLLVATSGCRTFNYTEEDLARERRLLAENMANAPRGGFAGSSGISIRPDLSKVNIGNVGCPNLGPGICPGK